MFGFTHPGSMNWRFTYWNLVGIVCRWVSMKPFSLRRGGSRGGGSSVDLFDACWGVFVGVFSSVTSSVVGFCVVGCSLIKSPGDKLSVDDDSLKGLFVGRFSIVFVGVDEVCSVGGWVCLAVHLSA